MKALSGAKSETQLIDAGDGAKETDRDFENDFSEEIPLTDFNTSPSLDIIRQEATKGEILGQASNHTDFGNGNFRHSADISDKIETTPKPKTEENFDAVSHLGPTSPTTQLSQEEFGRRKTEHGIVFNPENENESSSHVPPHCLPSPHRQVSSSFLPGRDSSSTRGNVNETVLSAAGRAILEFSGGVPNRFQSYPGSNVYYDGYNARDEASEMGQSTRYGREDAGNVTKWDCKRPKERSHDRAYKARSSMDSASGIHFLPVPPPTTTFGWVHLAKGRKIRPTSTCGLSCL